MMKKRGLMLVMLSLCMGVGAAWVANNWVQIRNGQLADINSNETPVVIASMNIPYGTKIAARHLDTIMVPKELLPGGAVVDAESVEGQVTTADMTSGEMVMKARLSEHGAGSTLAALIGENMRAVTVRVDDVVGVAGFLLPGNFVDVIAIKVDRSSKQAKTNTVLKKVRVLAVDQKARTDDSEPVVVRAVTLEMLPKESELLAKSRAEGSILLTLRNPNEEEAPVVAEVKKPAVKRVIRRRAYTPPAPEIIIIRGTKVDKQKTKG
jgi:pilus assembly protein CpaB